MVRPDRTSRPVPLRALILSLAALSVPVALALLAPEMAEDEAGMLVWLTALVPAFLFTYYRGWKGASLALAAGMAVLSSTQVFLVVSGLSSPNWTLLFVVVLVYMGLSFGIGLLAELLHRERRAAEEMALEDPLTGLPNRRHARIFLEAAFAGAERGAELSTVVFDVDHFKDFNDTYGHAAGDEVLKLLGEVLARETRDMDLSARWGGEEFLSILSSADEDGAVAFAERVRASLSDAPHRWGRVTLSAGVASHAPGMESPEVLIGAADRALYRAKARGRDRVATARTRDEGQKEPAGRTGGDEGTDASDPRRRSDETIMVVEDDDDTRTAIRRTLEFHGYTVEEAPSGEAALERVRRRGRPVDLVVTDIIMPGMSGFTLVDRLRELFPVVRVLYMSGYSMDDVSWDGAPGSTIDFVKKPMSVEELGTRVRALLDAPAKRTAGSGVS